MKTDLFENLESQSSLMHQLMDQKIKELLKKREDQIIERLAELGHVFSNEIEKAEFAKTRLTIHTYESKPDWYELYLDKTHLIAYWWNTVDFDGNTATYGKHPRDCNFNFKL